VESIRNKIALPKLYIKNEKRAAAILFAVYLVAMIPLLRANYDYIDDSGRKLYGYTGWAAFSRYISEYLSHVLHAGNYLADISPLPQLLAVGLLVAASILLIEQVHREQGIEQISLWDIAAVLPLGLSPYYLECLSYKYDSPYMALSVLASIAPLALREKRPAVYCGVCGHAGHVHDLSGVVGHFPDVRDFAGLFDLEPRGKRLACVLCSLGGSVSCRGRSIRAVPDEADG